MGGSSEEAGGPPYVTGDEFSYIVINIEATIPVPMTRTFDELAEDIKSHLVFIEGIWEVKKITSNLHPDPFNMPKHLRANVR